MSESMGTARSVRGAIGRYGPYVAAFLLVPLVVGAGNLGRQLSSVMHQPEAPAFLGELPPAPTHDPRRPVAVVLSSAFGAEITDFLPPYEILARSGHFQVYAIAPERKPLPLVNSAMKATSLDFVPHYSFDEYAKAVGRAPDVIAVPWFPEYTPARDAAVLEWIREHAGPNTTLLTICAGTEILADTGLLDGRTATTNVAWFGKLEQRFATTRWVRDVRYHDDGSIVTSTNLASGIDASLRVVAKRAGREVAEDVARQLGYRSTHYLDDPSFQPSMSFFAQVIPSIAYRFDREELGILLYDGVGEMALAGLVDPYTASYLARTHAVAPERRAIASRNGLTFVPRFDSRTALRLDRVVLRAATRRLPATTPSAPGARSVPSRRSRRSTATSALACRRTTRR
jgi:transcriptional regulator GlxA family with amidase domain